MVGQEHRSRASTRREGSGGERGQRQSRRQEQDARIGRASLGRQKTDMAELGMQTQLRHMHRADTDTASRSSGGREGSSTTQVEQHAGGGGRT